MGEVAAAAITHTGQRRAYARSCETVARSFTPTEASGFGKIKAKIAAGRKQSFASLMQQGTGEAVRVPYFAIGRGRPAKSIQIAAGRREPNSETSVVTDTQNCITGKRLNGKFRSSRTAASQPDSDVACRRGSLLRQGRATNFESEETAGKISCVDLDGGSKASIIPAAACHAGNDALWVGINKAAATTSHITVCSYIKTTDGAHVIVLALPSSPPGTHALQLTLTLAHDGSLRVLIQGANRTRSVPDSASRALESALRNAGFKQVVVCLLTPEECK